MKKQTSCADSYEHDAISVDNASKAIIDEITPITGKEKLALRSCLNRYLAENIFSPINVPSHINSAMDGYALAGTDLPKENSQTYHVLGTSYAGKPSFSKYKSGSVMRIMTGGVMPKGTDTVVMQEQVEVLNNALNHKSDEKNDKKDHGENNKKSNHDLKIKIQAEHQTGQNVRQIGEDIAKGNKVLSKGRQVTSADLGILASLGIGELYVYRRPRVAFFSTGDELCSIGEPILEGQIYDSNRYTLYGMLKQLDVDILDMGVVRDTPDAIRKAMISASHMADFVITSGGVSVGEADYIKPILKELGDTHFWKIAMKPGRPLTFGSIGSSWLFGLPGNPVAVMITFMQFVQPALHYLACGKIKQIITLRASCDCSIFKKPGRTEFQRGIFEQNETGELTVKRTGKQGSGILTSMSLANCFIVLGEESEGVEAGDTVEIQPFSGSLK